ncbi:NAD(+) synthase [Aureliella helgolandensis]|uniref:Glutamine-dependent NAD(+) synthetase n=1 Tax=Aureliella helgolandensis TaxID=2527968 RepID=A0A518GHB4_9BACT|nr:NAD(+) synthase [Aureliella helgolandensis]QDV27979.1 Glutamine-dependent NAD(+) synthetase [Aureliella helgolandensis]
MSREYPTKCGAAGLDFARVTAASHQTHIADPFANVGAALEVLRECDTSDVVVFGELSLTGYSCGDLFAQDALLESAADALAHLTLSVNPQQMVVVGLPVRVGGKLYNSAAVVYGRRVVGVVPKQYLPNYQEFYEARWFAAADGNEPEFCDLGTYESLDLSQVPFGIDLLFRRDELVVGIELCEDLWMPVPPSSLLAAGGANLLLNLSASNELIGKAAWREVLVRSQSGRCLAAYAYASAGPTESTTDVVFGGQCLVAENGQLLAQSQRVGDHGCSWFTSSMATADIDLQKLRHDRQITGSWQQCAQRIVLSLRTLDVDAQPAGSNLPVPPLRGDGACRSVSGHPFVPRVDAELHRRCAEVFGIQCAALAKRVSRLPASLPLNIGVSGGLDSTLALLVAAKTCREQEWPSSRIAGITMPGFGTTNRTLTAARDLMQYLEITSDEIDIRQLCLDTFIGLGHSPFGIDLAGATLEKFAERLQQVPAEDLHDLTFENVQARIRTMLLMNRGFVLGTGDLSEQALGWSTYNGDHMSMYNVNTSIPKTLVKFLVKYIAEHEFDGKVRDCLLGVVDTPISPELLPADQDGAITQLTEGTIGAYELHDFFLYHMVRYGARPRRIVQLAKLADFSREYPLEEIVQTLKLFLTRFFSNQFKRSCVPDGPKVGSVSLSPRGDWRMPSDGEAAAWLRELEDFR